MLRLNMPLWVPAIITIVSPAEATVKALVKLLIGYVVLPYSFWLAPASGVKPSLVATYYGPRYCGVTLYGELATLSFDVDVFFAVRYIE